MDIGKVIEIGERVIETPKIAPQREPSREPAPKEPARRERAPEHA